MSQQPEPPGAASRPPAQPGFQPPRPAYQPQQGFAPPDPVREELGRLRAEARSARAVAYGGVALALVATALAAFSLARTPQAPAGSPASTPALTVAAAPLGTIVLGAPGQGRPVIDIYEDFQCPACASVESYVSDDVDALVASKTVEVRYHVMSFLDAMLNNDSSVRAAHGGFCAHEQGKFLAWHDTLFSPDHHPKNEGDGWTDAQLRTLAGTAGLDVAAWSTCTASGKYAAQVRAANDLSLQGGVNSTPTFLLNGAAINLNAAVQSGGLKAYVEANS